MNTEASAATTVDSATTPETPAFDAGDQKTWSAEERAEWNTSGDIPRREQSDSATDDSKDPKTAATRSDSATDKKTADTASDSATDKTGKPHLKTTNDTERRITDLLDQVKRANDRAEAAERARTADPEKREVKPVSQPEPDKYVKLDPEKYFAEHKGAKYEEYLEDAIEHRAKWEQKQTAKMVEQAVHGERQRLAQEAAATELKTKWDEGKQRYTDFEDKIVPALKTFTEDQQVPLVLKHLVNESPIITDLMYTLASDPQEWQNFLALCKSNPGAAVRKIALVENLVQETLKGKAAPDTRDRGTDGKFKAAATGTDGAAKSEGSATQPRAPKPLPEVGGRGTATEDPMTSAARSGNFRDFSAEMTRKKFAKEA